MKCIMIFQDKDGQIMLVNVNADMYQDGFVDQIKIALTIRTNINKMHVKPVSINKIFYIFIYYQIIYECICIK